MGGHSSKSMNLLGIVIVPQQHAYILEHFGRYYRTLSPGLHFFIPLIQRVAYKQSLKEKSYDMKHQNAVTKENVPIAVDGVLYFKIVDAYKASYGAVDAEKYTLKLSQSITRSEIGKLSLDETFSARASTNQRILSSLQHATETWGIQCMRYEIKDIKVSDRVKKMMALEAESERFKRAEILKSQAKKTASVNDGEAFKASYILRAQGKASEISLKAKATSDRIKLLTNVINTSGEQAFNFLASEKYIESLESLKGKSIVIQNDLDDAKEILSKSRQIPQAIRTSKQRAIVKIGGNEKEAEKGGFLSRFFK